MSPSHQLIAAGASHSLCQSGVAMDTSALSKLPNPLTTSDGRPAPFCPSHVELRCYSLSRLDAIHCAEFSGNAPHK
jgi:hypothetical protein